MPKVAQIWGEKQGEKRREDTKRSGFSWGMPPSRPIRQEMVQRWWEVQKGTRWRGNVWESDHIWERNEHL